MKPLLALGAVLLAATACSGDEPPTPTSSPSRTSTDLGTDDVVCPSVDPATVAWTDYRAVDRAAPGLRAELAIVPLGGRNFCVAADASDSPDLAERIVSYTVELEGGGTYGERYETFDEKGSDELLNFPFSFHVYSGCRSVTSTVVVRRDGKDHAYRAETGAGPTCAGA